MAEGGTKHDGGKVQLDLLPLDVTWEWAKVMTIGARKYAPYNWEKGFQYSRVFAALKRHIDLWYVGEDTDEETGLSHLAHAMCCLSFLLAFWLRGIGTDNRPKLSPAQIARMKENLPDITFMNLSEVDSGEKND
jgi:hypothetical protein